MKISSGRTLYYGKGDVLTYRVYAKPLAVNELPESPYRGDRNVIFAHNITFSVSGDALLSSFTQGDNSMVVATDSMKNFIIRQAAAFQGNTAEGFLFFIGERFFGQYGHITAIELESERIPFLPVAVPGQGGPEQSGLVFRRSHNDHSGAKFSLRRKEGGAEVVGHRGVLRDLQLIKVSGSSFHGFVRDEYTTLPDSYDRPLFIFLDIYWTYVSPTDALDGDTGRYVAAEQIRDIAHTVFHLYKTPSIQNLIYRIGLRVLKRFPQLAEIGFESNNRTWETVVEPDPVTGAGVFTEPRPPFGFQGFTMTQEDLAAEEAEA
jgi:urate oxidase/2-oxo-4-hydroxy-4-carboxy-5-ureidoimidazoline decarboxylase